MQFHYKSILEGFKTRWQQIGKAVRGEETLTNDYELEQLLYYSEQLFAAAPYKVGDRIFIYDPITIDSETNPGYRKFAHMFTPGRPVEVVGVNHRNGKYTVWFRFETETYKNLWSDIEHLVAKENRSLLVMDADRFIPNWEDIPSPTALSGMLLREPNIYSEKECYPTTCVKAY